MNRWLTEHIGHLDSECTQRREKVIHEPWVLYTLKNWNKKDLVRQQEQPHWSNKQYIEKVKVTQRSHRADVKDGTDLRNIFVGLSGKGLQGGGVVSCFKG